MMNKELTRLLDERDKVAEQIELLEMKLSSIDEQIGKIQESCSHSNLSTIHSNLKIGDKEYGITISDCAICGERFLK